MIAAPLTALALLFAMPHHPSEDQQSFSEALWYAAADARGTLLCDQQLAKRHQKLFDKRFGMRIDSLRRRYFAKHPADPSFDIIPICRRSTAHRAEQVRFRSALDDFEPKLLALERTYGGH